MLFHLPLIGSAFKKTYFDQGLNRPVSEFVPIDQFYISYYATDLRRADRYTHVIYRSPVEMQRDIAAGMYADVSTCLMPLCQNKRQWHRRWIRSWVFPLLHNMTHSMFYLEQHCYLDLPEAVSTEIMTVCLYLIL